MKTVRKPSEIEKVRDQILNNALEIIATDGLSGLTMRTLAKQTGMTAPNLYNYFSNKDEIYITLMILGFEKLTVYLKESIENTTEPEVKALRFMKSYVQFGLENPNYYEIMFSSSSPKYNDYIGTAHEALSTKEHEMSMSLTLLSLQLIKEFGDSIGENATVEKSKEIMTGLWATLHGLVSLYKSSNIFYVIDNVEDVYETVLDKLVTQLRFIYQ